MLEIFFPTRREPPLSTEIQDANSALEQTKRDAAQASAEHAKASKRLHRAMEDSVEIAEEALRHRQ